MNRKEINTKFAPDALGPYSQAIQFNRLVFTSGQIPINPKTGQLVEGGIREQTNQVLKNLNAVLMKAGTSLAHTVKTTVFLKNMEDFEAMNEIYATYFNAPYPARSCVEVARLPKDVLVEIEAVALTR